MDELSYFSSMLSMMNFYFYWDFQPFGVSCDLGSFAVIETSWVYCLECIPAELLCVVCNAARGARLCVSWASILRVAGESFFYHFDWIS